MNEKILITENLHPLLAEKLQASGYDCTVSPGIRYEEVMQQAGAYTGMIVATRIKVDANLIDAASNLKFIARAGSGLDQIDVAYATTKGIRIISSPEGNANSVAEHAVGLLLAVFHNIVKSANETSRGKWLVEENRVHELEGKTIAIIGYGNTGRALARKLKPFGMQVLAYDKYLMNYSDEFATEAAMEQVFRTAEIVSFHIPLASETAGMVNATFLRSFSHSLFLINTSRGKIIHHADLLAAIHSGQVQQVASDVFENENFSAQLVDERRVFEQLIQTGRVIFTPHIAGKSFESKKKIAEVLFQKITTL